MNDQSKIRLSPQEMELVRNSAWILTKNGIMHKAKRILETLQAEQEQHLRSHPTLPAEVVAIPGKISRGENYKGLPYLVLDCPRFFDKEDHFAIRTLFWWGHFFSITLHLSGIYKKMYQDRIEKNFRSLKQEDFYISVGSDPWEHHFESSNYRSLREMESGEFIKYLGENEFIKLAKRFPLEVWDESSVILFATFAKLTGSLAD